MSTVYSLSDVQQHKTRASLWVVIDGNVYDITKFLGDHPGGEEVLLEQGGHDATESFNDIGHSQDARNLLKDYLIGKLDTAKTTASSAPVKQQASAPEKVATAAKSGTLKELPANAVSQGISSTTVFLIIFIVLTLVKLVLNW